jgi:HEAT repeats
MLGERLLSHIVYNMMQVVVVMGFAPLVAGVINRLKEIVQSKRAPGLSGTFGSYFLRTKSSLERIRELFCRGAVRALAGIALASGDITELIEALDSNGESVRQGAAHAPGRVGVNRADAVSALRERLSDTCPMVRRAATRALGKICGNPRRLNPCVSGSSRL